MITPRTFDQQLAKALRQGAARPDRKLPAVSVTLREEIPSSNDGPIQGRFVYLGGSIGWHYERLDRKTGLYVQGSPPRRSWLGSRFRTNTNKDQDNRKERTVHDADRKRRVPQAQRPRHQVQGRGRVQHKAAAAG